MMKVSIAALTLFVSSVVAVSSSINNSGLRNSNKKSLRRDLLSFKLDNVGDFFNQVTGNNNGDGNKDWGVIMNNNFGGNSMGFLDMIGSIDAIKDIINWDSMRDDLVGLLEEALADGNFEGLPAGLNWEAIVNNGGGSDIDWQSILKDVDLESIMGNFDLPTLIEGFDFDQLQNMFSGNFGDGFDFDFENLSSIDWKDGNAWQQMLTDVMEGIDLSDIDIDWTDVNACEVMQLVNGIAPSFSVNGNCQCDGNLATGLNISCGFSGCAFDDEGCGEVSFEMSLAQEDAGSGMVNMNVCTNFDNINEEEFEELCISYAMDRSNGGQPVQTCGTSYGDDICECSIDEKSCVTLDCSAIREDAVMDQCMPMGMLRNKKDFDNFVPPFQMLVANAEVQEEDNVNVDNINSKPKNKKNKKNKKRKFTIGGGKKKRTCGWVKNQIKKNGNIDICDEQTNNNPTKTVRDRCNNIKVCD